MYTEYRYVYIYLLNTYIYIYPVYTYIFTEFYIYIYIFISIYIIHSLTSNKISIRWLGSMWLFLGFEDRIEKRSAHHPALGVTRGTSLDSLLSEDYLFSKSIGTLNPPRFGAVLGAKHLRRRDTFMAR